MNLDDGFIPPMSGGGCSILLALRARSASLFLSFSAGRYRSAAAAH